MRDAPGRITNVAHNDRFEFTLRSPSSASAVSADKPPSHDFESSVRRVGNSLEVRVTTSLPITRAVVWVGGMDATATAWTSESSPTALDVAETHLTGTSPGQSWRIATTAR